MIRGVRYVHTNLAARDFRRLAKFYQEVFGCEFVPPERTYTAADLESGTGVPGVALRGTHLRLPGHGPEGPTLEVFEYSIVADGGPGAVNRPGLGHLAFSVASVEEARAEVLANGGSVLGEVVTLSPIAGSRVTWCYVRDPERNIIELQSWSRD